MTSRMQLMCFAAFTALATLSGVSRADESAASDEVTSKPVTCAEAKNLAWFMHELEQTDGAYGNTVDVPVECQRELIAKDAEILATIHAAVAENE